MGIVRMQVVSETETYGAVDQVHDVRQFEVPEDFFQVKGQPFVNGSALYKEDGAIQVLEALVEKGKALSMADLVDQLNVPLGALGCEQVFGAKIFVTVRTTKIEEQYNG